MRLEWRTTVGAALFLGVVSGFYWFFSYEDTGAVLLVFGCSAYLLLAGYLLLQWTRRDGLPRPEDKDDGTYAETAGESLGFFPAASIWPVAMGLGATFIGLALVFGTWYWLPGLGLFFGAIIGYATEAEAANDAPETVQEAASRSDSAALPGDTDAAVGTSH